MLSNVADVVARARRVLRPPRASFSYRYQLAADTHGTGPMSAIIVLTAMDHRAKNHARFEGAPEPHPLRGVDDETRETVRQEVNDEE